MGAALTYARRYALFTLVGIAGEDDLDAPDLCAPRTALGIGGIGGSRDGPEADRGANPSGSATGLRFRRVAAATAAPGTGSRRERRPVSARINRLRCGTVSWASSASCNRPRAQQAGRAGRLAAKNRAHRR